MRHEPEKEDVEEEVDMSGAGALLFFSTVSFLLSLMFLSQNVTGNVIGNFSTNGAEWFGGIFFVLAIAGFLFYARKRKVVQRR